jgi:signal transduction histidine kinase
VTPPVVKAAPTASKPTALAAFARSLAARLAVGAAAWVTLALVISGVALSELYRQSTLRALDRDIAALLDGLSGAVELDAKGAPFLRAPPNDPRFFNASSGRYWQITTLTDGPVKRARSESLWDEKMVWPGQADRLSAAAGAPQVIDADGPYGQPVRLGAQVIALEQGKARLLVMAAFDRREAESDVRRFQAALIVGLVSLGLGLVLAAVLQVLFGLRPLGRLQSDLAAVRAGRSARLTGDYPTEVAPLTQEMNALIDHNAEVVERARTHVGNLAHALKTPLSVILNEARNDATPFGDLVRRNANAMGANIDHYLKRAQAAARAETVGVRTDVAEAVGDIVRMLEKLYGRQKDLDIEVNMPAGLWFRGERQDFDEMAGNLIENACKYGGGRVLVAAKWEADGLAIAIEDNGPGLLADQRATALARGARLDESAPGQGLGLAIVAELAGMYGGRLELGDSPLGGLAARLRLPAAT